MPPFLLPLDFLVLLLLEAWVLDPEPPALALARAQRARAAAAIRSRPAAERPPRRLRLFPPRLAGAEVTELAELVELPELLERPEPPRIVVSRLCSWSICFLIATASSSCLTDRSMAQL